MESPIPYSKTLRVLTTKRTRRQDDFLETTLTRRKWGVCRASLGKVERKPRQQPLRNIGGNHAGGVAVMKALSPTLDGTDVNWILSAAKKKTSSCRCFPFLVQPPCNTTIRHIKQREYLLKGVYLETETFRTGNPGLFSSL